MSTSIAVTGTTLANRGETAVVIAFAFFSALEWVRCLEREFDAGHSGSGSSCVQGSP